MLTPEYFNRIPFRAGGYVLPATPETRTPTQIVLHTVESPEGPSNAENVARYLIRRWQNEHVKASVHYLCDSDSVVQMTQIRDVAAGAPGVNRSGVHIELHGYANQTANQWNDTQSTRALIIAACLCSWVIIPKLRNNYHVVVPLRRLTRNEIRGGAPGFLGHMDATAAFGTQGGHTDPGPNFPWQRFLRYVAEARRSDGTPNANLLHF